MTEIVGIGRTWSLRANGNGTVDLTLRPRGRGKLDCRLGTESDVDELIHRLRNVKKRLQDGRIAKKKEEEA
jgi:hypothetical protein